MWRGFWKLTWVEIKIFLREPMGVVGSIGIPVIVFLVLGRVMDRRDGGVVTSSRFLGEDLPIFASIFIALGAVLSLVAIISIYRESGILKRLRATPLRPPTILGAHVFVKLVFTSATLGLMMLAGRRFYPVDLEVHAVSFGLALLVSSLSIFAVGFVIASIVPTARFAQPIGAAILYSMVAVSGIFVPLAALPLGWKIVGDMLPLSHAVSFLRGAWSGASWFDHLGNLAVLALYLVLGTAVSSKIFRWE